MANVCCGDYAFFSQNREELQQFHDTLIEILEGVAGKTIDSESGEFDYEVLQREFGIPEGEWEDGRGFITGISNLQTDEISPFFLVKTQDCWQASPNVMNGIIMKAYRSINFVYMEDEPAEGIATTSDMEGRFFAIPS